MVMEIDMIMIKEGVFKVLKIKAYEHYNVL